MLGRIARTITLCGVLIGWKTTFNVWCAKSVHVRRTDRRLSLDSLNAEGAVRLRVDGQLATRGIPATSSGTTLPVILEGVITTRNLDGSVNIAPMGPVVDEEVTSLVLRPFPGSTTCVNLLQHRCGVFHVVDDVLLIAQGAIDEWHEEPETIVAEKVEGFVLENASRWYEFEVAEIDDSEERWSVKTRIVHRGHGRDLFGFNRAKHAVIEAAILSTRLHLIPESEVRRQLTWLEPMVTKTGGDRELRAFAMLVSHISEFYQ